MDKLLDDEYDIALDCKDIQANAMSIDFTGSYILLAGRRCIAVKKLNGGYNNNLVFPRQGKYDVGAAEWNPTSHNKEICIISSNERLEILKFKNDSLSVSHSVRTHSRVITDINWHRFNPNVLASCSADTFIHLWDIRDIRKPTLSLSAIAEASQVRWNRLSEHVIATAHEGDIKIWDERNNSAPLQYIAAHVAKIYGLDWSPKSENQIASSSQDCTVKFFDITSPRKAEFFISTTSPVWRARYAPFGSGLITVVVPQIRRGDNNLLLWNITNRAAPVHTFVGHKDVVLEFQWRQTNDANFQLVTWSKDQTLLVWNIETYLQKLCGHEPSIKENLDGVDVVGGPFKKSLKIQPLQQEFSLLNVNIPNLEVKNMDAVARIVNVAYRTNITVNLQVSFPNEYPYGIPPVFHIMPDTNINDTMTSQLIQTLNNLALQRVMKNRTCLEPCLRQMVLTLELLSQDIDNDKNYERLSLEPINVLTNYNDAYIPFPKTSGARFGSINLLVCFGKTIISKRVGTKNESTSSNTPRALSALESIIAKRSTEQMTVSAYYFQKQKQRSKTKYQVSKASKEIVHLYDVSNLFLFNRQLAEEYILDGDVATICKHNAAAAAVIGRRDLVQAWTLTELSLTKRFSLDHNPCGVELIISLIKYYATHFDIQMAAMLCCIYEKEEEKYAAAKALKVERKRVPESVNYYFEVPKSYFQLNNSPYHTIPSGDLVTDGWVLPLLKHTRSTSLDNLKVEKITTPTKIQKKPVPLYEYYKMAYADILCRWRLPYNKTEILKHMSTIPNIYKGAEFVSECASCHKSRKNANTETCRCRLQMQCAICNISVRGSSVVCINCGHGGHTNHMIIWFKSKQICPKCNCNCLTFN